MAYKQQVAGSGPTVPHRLLPAAAPCIARWPMCRTLPGAVPVSSPVQARRGVGTEDADGAVVPAAAGSAGMMRDLLSWRYGEAPGRSPVGDSCAAGAGHVAPGTCPRVVSRSPVRRVRSRRFRCSRGEPAAEHRAVDHTHWVRIAGGRGQIVLNLAPSLAMTAMGPRHSQRQADAEDSDVLEDAEASERVSGLCGAHDPVVTFRGRRRRRRGRTCRGSAGNSTCNYGSPQAAALEAGRRPSKPLPRQQDHPP